MGGYVVRLITTRYLRQRFHVRIESTNGQSLFVSEKLLNHAYAYALAESVADKLGAGPVREGDAG